MSGGIFVGKVKIVRNEADCKALDKTHVAIVAVPDRKHIHLLKRASAIVTETGGLLGHIAKVAREDNLTFVGGIQDAASLFKDKDLVCVDGSKGTVTYA
ncbi:MAG: hypothetical protein UX89_C0005G0010 [Parcubacteria group bacterium GW2011_GWA2_47_16]|nr:MAG: hypothetical protein UX89_C0005G0010 [Parcubacteria group bacterium GW2011_GWA2_47_16]